MKANASTTERLWVYDASALGLCVLVTLAAFVFAILPLLRQRSAVRTLAQQLETRDRECSSMNTSLLTLKKQTIAIREQLETSDITLEYADRINQRVAEITEIFADHHLLIDDVQTGRITMGKRCDLVPIRLSGSGGFREYAKVFHQLSKILPDVCVAGFDLQGVPERPGESGTFAMDLFWFAAPSLGRSDT